MSGAGGKAAGGVQMVEGRQEWRSKACNGFWADDGTARVRCPAVHRSFCSGGPPCGALTPQTLEALAQERGRGSRSLFCDCNMRAGASVDEDAWGSDVDGESGICRPLNAARGRLPLYPALPALLPTRAPLAHAAVGLCRHRCCGLPGTQVVAD